MIDTKPLPITFVDAQALLAILEQIQGNTIVDDVAGRQYPHLVQIEAEFRHEAGPLQ